MMLSPDQVRELERTAIRENSAALHTLISMYRQMGDKMAFEHWVVYALTTMAEVEAATRRTVVGVMNDNPMPRT